MSDMKWEIMFDEESWTSKDNLNALIGSNYNKRKLKYLFLT